MTTERQGIGHPIVQETSIGLPLAAVVLFAALLSLSAMSVGTDELPVLPSTEAAAEKLKAEKIEASLNQ